MKKFNNRDILPYLEEISNNSKNTLSVSENIYVLLRDAQYNTSEGDLTYLKSEIENSILKFEINILKINNQIDIIKKITG